MGSGPGRPALGLGHCHRLGRRDRSGDRQRAQPRHPGVLRPHRRTLQRPFRKLGLAGLARYLRTRLGGGGSGCRSGQRSSGDRRGGMERQGDARQDRQFQLLRRSDSGRGHHVRGRQGCRRDQRELRRDGYEHDPGERSQLRAGSRRGGRSGRRQQRRLVCRLSGRDSRGHRCGGHRHRQQPGQFLEPGERSRHHRPGCEDPQLRGRWAYILRRLERDVVLRSVGGRRRGTSEVSRSRTSRRRKSRIS